MNSRPARLRSTEPPRCRASGEASPTLDPLATSRCLGIAPPANNRASRSVVLPLPAGPTIATQRAVLERLSMAGLRQKVHSFVLFFCLLVVLFLLGCCQTCPSWEPRFLFVVFCF